MYSHVAPFLTDWQHDFVKGRSCATQLVITHHQWAKTLDDGLQVDGCGVFRFRQGFRLRFTCYTSAEAL